MTIMLRVAVSQIIATVSRNLLVSHSDKHAHTHQIKMRKNEGLVGLMYISKHNHILIALIFINIIVYEWLRIGASRCEM